MTIHYIPRPTFEKSTKERRILLSACGERPADLCEPFTCIPALADCPACKRAMVAEERPGA